MEIRFIACLFLVDKRCLDRIVVLVLAKRASMLCRFIVECCFYFVFVDLMSYLEQLIFVFVIVIRPFLNSSMWFG